MSKLPNDEIMRQMAKMAVESATSSFAKKAREFAKTLPASVSGSVALEAFASAIESTNEKQFAKENEQ